jgi:Leucine-rich repeat (LRR) protein
VQAVEMDENETGKCDRLIGAAALHFKKLQALIIDNSDVSDEGLAHLKNMPDLAVISALSCQAINGKCFSTLSQLPNLQRLSMRGNVINAQDLKYLALCPRLTYLNLRGKTINPDGLKTIANSATVKELVVSDNRKIDDKALAFLLPFRTLCSLDLSGTAVTDAGMKYLTKLPGLQTLKLERTAITLKGLIVLKPLKLKELSVSSALFKPIEVEKSGKLAAHITFTDDSNQVPEDLKTDFAPLH